MKTSKQRGRKKFWVCFYLVDRAYGGPEEGGWWYDCSEPDAPSGIPPYHAYARNFRHESTADRYAEKLRRKYLKQLNADLPDISSVNSDGQWRVYVTEGEPSHFPKTRPYYD